MDVGDGWCEGELDGQRGLFPISYVKMVRGGYLCVVNAQQ